MQRKQLEEYGKLTLGIPRTKYFKDNRCALKDILIEKRFKLEIKYFTNINSTIMDNVKIYITYND